MLLILDCRATPADKVPKTWKAMWTFRSGQNEERLSDSIFFFFPLSQEPDSEILKMTVHLWYVKKNH